MELSASTKEILQANIPEASSWPLTMTHHAEQKVNIILTSEIIHPFPTSEREKNKKKATRKI